MGTFMHEKRGKISHNYLLSEIIQDTGLKMSVIYRHRRGIHGTYRGGVTSPSIQKNKNVISFAEKILQNKKGRIPCLATVSPSIQKNKKTSASPQNPRKIKRG